MIKYIFIISFLSLLCLVIFALLKVASDFDDNCEEFFGDFYEDNNLDSTYDYYDNRFN